MEQVLVHGIVCHADLIVAQERIEAQDLSLGELTYSVDMAGGSHRQRGHHLIPIIIGTREPGGILQKRQVMDGHYLGAHEDGAQASKTEDHIMAFGEEEEGEDALFP